MTSPTTDRRYGVVGSKGIKAPVKAATTANITLSGEQTIDGAAVVESNAAGVPDRVLVKNQTDPALNGIYDVSTGAWVRSADADGTYDLALGTLVMPTAGGQEGQFFRCGATDPVVPGTSSMPWYVAASATASPVVSTIAAMKALDKTNNSRAFVLGYASAGDGGGGVYYYDASDTTSSDNSGTIIVASDGGRWKLATQTVISVKQFGATGDGSTDDTAAIVAANTYCYALGKRLFFPAGTYKYTPAQAIDVNGWIGEGMRKSIVKVYAAAATYSGTCFRHTGYDEMALMSIQEATNSTTYPGILVQCASDPPSGASSSFVAYAQHRKLSLQGGAVVRDIQNVFSWSFIDCETQNGGIGTKIIPDSTAGGFVSSLVFINEFNNNNNQGWNVNPPVNSYTITVVGGATQNQQTTASFFQTLFSAAFYGHYAEESTGAATTWAQFNGVAHLWLQVTVASNHCDIYLGTNTSATIVGQNSTSCHLLGGDTTQTVTLIDCLFAASGNTAFASWKYINLVNSLYSGTYYQKAAFNLGNPVMAVNYAAAPTAIASASTIAPVTPVSFVSGTTTIDTITVPSWMVGGGQITLIPTGLWSLSNAGNVALGVTAVVSKALILTYDSGTSKWYPSYQ